MINTLRRTVPRHELHWCVMALEGDSQTYRVLEWCESEDEAKRHASDFLATFGDEPTTVYVMRAHYQTGDL